MPMFIWHTVQKNLFKPKKCQSRARAILLLGATYNAKLEITINIDDNKRDREVNFLIFIAIPVKTIEHQFRGT